MYSDYGNEPTGFRRSGVSQGSYLFFMYYFVAAISFTTSYCIYCFIVELVGWPSYASKIFGSGFVDRDQVDGYCSQLVYISKYYDI